MTDTPSPFLTLVCRCCWRPNMLAKAIRSALVQTDRDLEIIFIPDMRKRGVWWANQQFAVNLHRVNGKYVYALDDDSFLATKHLVKRLKRVPGNPGVIMVKGRRPKIKPHVLPKESVWGHRERLKVTSTNGACFVVRADLWKKHAHRYGQKGSGDWNMMNALRNDSAATFYWLDLLAKEAQQLGRGVRFENCGRDWWKRTIKRFRLERMAKGDWRLPLYRWGDEQIRKALK